jgi:hypothetical protein|tara:strand:- start:566 stop:856 length:291 start_codon:yes stop_codon:yes gene_type:complete
MGKIVYFDYELPDGTELSCEAEVSPGRPEQGPTYDSGGEPAEAPEVEIISTIDSDSRESIDTSDLTYETWGGRIVSVDDDLREAAFEALAEQQEDI